MTLIVALSKLHLYGAINISGTWNCCCMVHFFKMMCYRINSKPEVSKISSFSLQKTFPFIRHRKLSTSFQNLACDNRRLHPTLQHWIFINLLSIELNQSLDKFNRRICSAFIINELYRLISKFYLNAIDHTWNVDPKCSFKQERSQRNLKKSKMSAI